MNEGEPPFCSGSDAKACVEEELDDAEPNERLTCVDERISLSEEEEAAAVDRG